MLIISYYDDPEMAANAISQLNQMPIVKDVSFIARENTDSPATVPYSDISQKDVYVEPYNYGSVYSSLLAKDAQVAYIPNTKTGDLVVGGAFADLLNSDLDLETQPQRSIGWCLKQIGIDSEICKNISNQIKDDYIVLLVTTTLKYQIDIIRELQNLGTIDYDIHPSDVIPPE